VQRGAAPFIIVDKRRELESWPRSKVFFFLCEVPDDFGLMPPWSGDKPVLLLFRFLSLGGELMFWLRVRILGWRAFIDGSTMIVWGCICRVGGVGYSFGGFLGFG
jgi:hypothetical protein